MDIKERRIMMGNGLLHSLSLSAGYSEYGQYISILSGNFVLFNWKSI